MQDQFKTISKHNVILNVQLVENRRKRGGEKALCRFKNGAYGAHGASRPLAGLFRVT